MNSQIKININSKPMPKRLNPQVKFKVVLEALQNQKTFPEIARSYGVRPQLISIWKREFLQRGPNIFQDYRERKSEDRKIGELEQIIGKKEIEIQLLKKLLGQASSL